MTQRLPLIGGAYAARSVIANAQRCINYYPEKNRQDAPVPFTLYQRPGLTALVQGFNAPVRGLYRATNGNGYGVIGQYVYYIDANFVLTQIGVLLSPAYNPVSFSDNGIEILLVDSSQFGYTINLATNVFAQLVDPTGLFVGATRVDYLDTFFVMNQPGTNRFISSLSNSTTFDALYVAAKTAYPEPLASLIVNRREILLLGQLKSEIWYNAGAPQFPFQELPGTYVEHGTCAPYSLSSNDISIYWLEQSLQGQGIVVRQKGYETHRISNHAIEYAIEQMIANSSIADAIGYNYQQSGHSFYVLNFPSGDQTWVFDEAIEDPDLAWHQRAWTDSNGVLHRDRTNCFALLYGKLVVGDWENGTIYALDTKRFNDFVNGEAMPISYIRSFPHIVEALTLAGQAGMAHGKQMQFRNFMLDLEVGNAPEAEPLVGLRWSSDRGKTWGQTVLQNAGKPGAFATAPTWGGVVGFARDVVFEVSHSLGGAAALQGAWVEAEVMAK